MIQIDFIIQPLINVNIEPLNALLAQLQIKMFAQNEDLLVMNIYIMETDSALVQEHILAILLLILVMHVIQQQLID